MSLKIPCSNISQALAELQPGESLLIRNRPAMSSTQPRKAKTSCALKFK